MSILAGPSIAHDYWPTAGEITYSYENDQGDEITLSMTDGDLLLTHGNCWSRHWLDTEADHLYLAQEEALCLIGDMRIPTGFSYAPPLVVLDPSVDVGQAWTSSSVATDHYGNQVAVGVSGESVSRETVVVPAGTFDAVVLDLDFGSAYLPSGLYRLALGVGPVVLPGGYRLVDVEGIVPTGEVTWSELKSLYR